MRAGRMDGFEKVLSLVWLGAGRENEWDMECGPIARDAARCMPTAEVRSWRWV